MLRDRLTEQGYDVILTRENNETAISNAERACLANDAGAEFSLRIHANGIVIAVRVECRISGFGVMIR